VELRTGIEADGDALRQHCRATLTPYEVPARVYIVDALPRGAALKVDRRRLLAMLEELGAGTALVKTEDAEEKEGPSAFAGERQPARKAR
jgi:acyl-coenzyme A synthetase/AMP-(fatty) acid ligase